MGTVLGLILVAALVWYAVRSSHGRSDEKTAGRVTAADASTALRSGKSFTLQGRTCRLSGKGRVPVVGESYRQKELRRVVKGQELAGVGDWANALRRDALLIPEPSNKFDRNAVRVLIEAPGDWMHVGYLSAENAPLYVGILNDLIERGCIPLVEGRIIRSSSGIAVYLHLANADACAFENEEPEFDVVMPERQCAVTRESDHQDVLGRLSEGLYWATLHPSTVTMGKFAGEFTLEVRVDDARVGELTAAQGIRYRAALVDDLPAACEASVFAGKSGIEVTLALPKVD